MKYITTPAIILARTNCGEADRILTVITPSNGKLRIYAKGVRKLKSKLAAGLELLSISSLTLLRGKSDLLTITSSKLDHHFVNIVGNLARTTLAYEAIKLVNRNTEDVVEQEYFDLLHNLLKSLDDTSNSTDIIWLWFCCRLLVISGHGLNLRTDTEGRSLDSDARYNLSYADMTLELYPEGLLDADDIKVLRLASACDQPSVLGRVSIASERVKNLSALLDNITRSTLRS